MDNLDNYIFMEKVCSLSLKISDMVAAETNLTMDESDVLFSKLVDLFEEFYQYPDYNNY